MAYTTFNVAPSFTAFRPASFRQDTTVETKKLSFAPWVGPSAGGLSLSGRF